MARAIDRQGKGADPPSSPAECASAYVTAKVKEAAGHLFHQGARKPPLPCASASPWVRQIAEQRFYGVSTAVARALVAWADGFPVELLTSIPTPSHVLELQAKGARCVSLLPDGLPTAPHADGLAFAIHDLCHLDKFIARPHHAGQVGFFACLHTLTHRHQWSAFEANFDEAFRLDWQHVAADMNGSAVFLFAALKMKLKMAVRRRFAVDRGTPAPTGGALTVEEARVYDDRLSELLTLFDFGPDVMLAAKATSARRDDPRAALRLLDHFEDIGRRSCPPATRPPT